MWVAHVHGCYLPPDHAGGCLTDTPHQFGPDGCKHCTKRAPTTATDGRSSERQASSRGSR